MLVCVCVCVLFVYDTSNALGTATAAHCVIIINMRRRCRGRGCCRRRRFNVVWVPNSSVYKNRLRCLHTIFFHSLSHLLFNLRRIVLIENLFFSSLEIILKTHWYHNRHVICTDNWIRGEFFF